MYAVTCDPELRIHAVDDVEAQGEDHWTVSPDGKRVTYNHHTPRPPVELKTPQEPKEVERLMHELTHLPYQPLCEACGRGRGRDLPHLGLKLKGGGSLEGARLRPTICMDWFEVASSTESAQKSAGITQALLIIDAEIGFVAAVPSPGKGDQHLPHLTRMVLTFLQLMRHQNVILRKVTTSLCSRH